MILPRLGLELELGLELGFGCRATIVTHAVGIGAADQAASRCSGNGYPRSASVRKSAIDDRVLHSGLPTSVFW